MTKKFVALLLHADDVKVHYMCISKQAVIDIWAVQTGRKGCLAYTATQDVRKQH